MSRHQFRRQASDRGGAERGEVVVSGEGSVEAGSLALGAGQPQQRLGSDGGIAGLRNTAIHAGRAGKIATAELEHLALREGTHVGLHSGCRDRMVDEATARVWSHLVAREHEHDRVMREPAGEACSGVWEFRCSEAGDPRERVLDVTQPASERSRSDVGRMLQPNLYTLLLQRSVLLEQSPSQPSQGDHQDERDPEEQDH